MSGSNRNVWLIVGVTLGLVALGSWIGFRWLQRAFTGVMAEGRQSYDEGTRLGRSLTATACLDTAFARHARAPSGSMGQQITEGVFLEGCLGTGTPDGLCDSIPPTGNLSQMMRFSVWSVEQCRVHGLTDRNCPRLLQAVSNHCRRKTTAGG
jgi:hypothetical protein